MTEEELKQARQRLIGRIADKVERSPEWVVSTLKKLGHASVREDQFTFLVISLDQEIAREKQQNDRDELDRQLKEAFPEKTKKACPIEGCEGHTIGGLSWRWICSIGGLQHRLWHLTNNLFEDGPKDLAWWNQHYKEHSYPVTAEMEAETVAELRKNWLKGRV